MDRKKRQMRVRAEAQRSEGMRGPSGGDAGAEALRRDLSGEADEDRKGSFLGKFNAAFQDKLKASRSDEPHGESRVRPPATAHDPDDLAMRRPRGGQEDRMVVPNGVVIEGSLNSNSETEIAGRIEGDVTVDGRLILSEGGQVSGNVRTSSSRVEGVVSGKVECTNELDLGATGKLNADALAGKRMTLAGQVQGNVTCGGLLRLVSSARVTGNIRARSIVVEEGAIFNGSCSTPAPKARKAE